MNICLKSLLVFLFLSFPFNSFAKELDYHNLLMVYMVSSGDTAYTKFVDDWMKAFRPQIWNRYQNDEFSLDERRQETKETVEKDLLSFDLNEPFILNISVEFGEYNFENQMFEFRPFSSDQYFTFGCPIYGSLPPRFLVSFSNPDCIDGLPFKKESAKKFLEGRNFGSYFDRKLTATVTAIFNSSTADYKIRLKIINVKFLDPKNANRVVYEYKSPQGNV